MTDDIAALFVCDDIANIMRETDWLALRQIFARSEKPAIAFRMTTTATINREQNTCVTS
jgi:hypothetical protein